LSSSPSAYLRIEGATKSFDGVQVVSDFNLDVGTGEFVSLLGPSGCGKTTLLRMIAGFEFPDRGRVVLDSRDITQLPAHKRPVNMVFQRVTLFPHLDVFENIAFGLRLARVPDNVVHTRVGEALELVRLPGFEKRGVHTLSGGQAQRVALARAIVNRPKVLLFDEPLSSLDLQIRRELQVELKDIHRELQGTFVYVTHDQEEAMSMSDRVVVMNRGRIIQVGSPVDLYRSPISLFVASFVGSSNVWHGEVVESDENGTVVSVDGTSLRGAIAPGMKPGDRVAMVLRAEVAHVSVVSRGAPADPLASMQGTVADVLFVGAVVNYQVDVAGRRITVSRPSYEEALVLGEGKAVTVSWNPRDAHVLPENDAVDERLNSHSEQGRNR
jgi:spermidine/putrescine transport system ATP-binding protein